MIKYRKLFVLLIAHCLVACVSISNEREISVWQNEDLKYIEINIPTNELEFNWHGGGWFNGINRYKIAVPKTKIIARGTEIRLTKEMIGTILPVNETSEVAEVGCNLNVKISDDKNIEYEFNGNYTIPEIYCKK